MPVIRSRMARFIGTGCFAILFAASSWAQLVIAVSTTPLSAPFIVAESKGYFRDEGVSVRLEPCVGGHRCLQRVLEGTAHLGTASDLPIMFRSFERNDFRVLATFASSAKDPKLLVRKSAGIARAGDLEVKRVGFIAGSSSEYFLDTFAILNGASPAKLLRVPIQADQALAALKRGEIDAVAIWEPYAHAAMKALGNEVAVLKGLASYELTFSLIAAQSVAGSRDADLARVLKALDRAVTYIGRDPANAQALMRKYTELDDEAMRAIWPDFRFSLSLEQSFIITLESEARWAQQRNLVRGAGIPNYLQFLHSAPLSAVKPRAVTVRF